MSVLSYFRLYWWRKSSKWPCFIMSFQMSICLLMCINHNEVFLVNAFKVTLWWSSRKVMLVERHFFYFIRYNWWNKQAFRLTVLVFGLVSCNTTYYHSLEAFSAQIFSAWLDFLQNHNNNLQSCTFCRQTYSIQYVIMYELLRSCYTQDKLVLHIHYRPSKLTFLAILLFPGFRIRITCFTLIH